MRRRCLSPDIHHNNGIALAPELPKRYRFLRSSVLIHVTRAISEDSRAWRGQKVVRGVSVSAGRSESIHGMHASSGAQLVSSSNESSMFSQIKYGSKSSRSKSNRSSMVGQQSAAPHQGQTISDSLQKSSFQPQ
jgi:hypothetical protein